MVLNPGVLFIPDPVERVGEDAVLSAIGAEGVQRSAKVLDLPSIGILTFQESHLFVQGVLDVELLRRWWWLLFDGHGREYWY